MPPHACVHPIPSRLVARLRAVRLPISGRYLGGRLLTGLLAVWGAVTLVFFALYSTGNPALLLVPPDAPPEEAARLTALMGFDQPVPVQYAKFLQGLAHRAASPTRSATGPTRSRSR